MAEFQIPLYEQMREAATRTSTSGSRPPASSTTGATTAPGLFMKYLRRGSGYYIDVGAADLVADGDDRSCAGATSTT